MNEIYREWLGAFAAIGTPAIGRDTAARILAVVYVHGNNEAFVYNRKFLDEVEHIKRMFHVDGGETPDAELVVLLQDHIKELEDYERVHRNDKTDDEVAFHNHAPQWATELFWNRYGIKLIN